MKWKRGWVSSPSKEDVSSLSSLAHFIWWNHRILRWLNVFPKQAQERTLSLRGTRPTVSGSADGGALSRRPDHGIICYASKMHISSNWTLQFESNHSYPTSIYMLCYILYMLYITSMYIYVHTHLHWVRHEAKCYWQSMVSLNLGEAWEANVYDVPKLGC